MKIIWLTRPMFWRKCVPAIVKCYRKGWRREILDVLIDKHLSLVEVVSLLRGYGAYMKQQDFTFFDLGGGLHSRFEMTAVPPWHEVVKDFRAKYLTADEAAQEAADGD